LAYYSTIWEEKDGILLRELRDQNLFVPQAPKTTFNVYVFGYSLLDIFFANVLIICYHL